jgi:hypothetical protein
MRRDAQCRLPTALGGALASLDASSRAAKPQPPPANISALLLQILEAPLGERLLQITK